MGAEAQVEDRQTQMWLMINEILVFLLYLFLFEWKEKMWQRRFY